jgi:predicted urease superfamily metal-dependent hydrolase
MHEVADLQTEITIETDNIDNTERKNQMIPPKEENNLLAKFDLSLVVESVLYTSIVLKFVYITL